MNPGWTGGKRMLQKVLRQRSAKRIISFDLKSSLSYLSKGSARSVKLKKNIVGMLFIKGGSIAINLMLVPLTLNYVNSDTYGIWLTLSSMVAWMSFFDVGINNGLKNKLAEAIAHEDYNLGKKYVSTTYALLCAVFIPILIIGLCVAPFINWYSLLNLSNSVVPDLLSAVLIVITYFCVQFILSTINVILLADQSPAESSLRTLLQHIVSFLIITILLFTTKGSLIKLCVAFCISPLIVLLLFNFTLFSGRYKQISPSFKSIDVKVLPSLMKLGAQFFIIQIAAIIQYQMMNFIIIRYYGATEVTAYNIANKYFNVLYMVWGILITPLWAATTDALSKGDFLWIRNTARRYLSLFFLFLLMSVVMLWIAPFIYHLWIGDKVLISFGLSLWNMIYFLVLMFGCVFVYILNGAGLLKVQTVASIISPFVFLLSFYYFVHHGYGVYSVLISAVLSNFNGFLLAPLQFYHHFKAVR